MKINKILRYSGITVGIIVILVILTILFAVSLFLELINLPFRRKAKENSRYYLYNYYD